MNKNEILKQYQNEKDEQLIWFQYKAMNKAFGASIILFICLTFFSFAFQDTTTVYDTLYILVMPMICIIYGIKAFYQKSYVYALIAGIWFIIILLHYFQYIQQLFI